MRAKAVRSHILLTLAIAVILLGGSAIAAIYDSSYVGRISGFSVLSVSAHTASGSSSTSGSFIGPDSWRRTEVGAYLSGRDEEGYSASDMCTDSGKDSASLMIDLMPTE